MAGVLSGSLHSAALDAVASSPESILKGGVFRSTPDEGDVLRLAIPGFQGTPHVQVFANPARVVVDLPGVNRGVALSRKELKGLTSPRVLRWRVGQFSTQPQLTRVVLEVKSGTQAEVSVDATGVSIHLTSGQGAVQARVLPAEPVPAVAAAVPAQPADSPAPAVAVAAADPMQALAPAAAAAPPLPAAPQAVEVQAPAPLPPVAALPAVPEPAAAVLPVPQPAASVTALPAAPVPQPASALPAVAPATPAAVPAASPQAQPAVAVPVPATAELPSAPVAVTPLVHLPAATASSRNLPALTVKSLAPATAALAQDAPLVTLPNRRDDRRAGRTLGDSGPHYTGARMTIDVVGTDLTSFLRIIADTAHLNLIVDSDVQGIYTFKFTDTPWDQVLDVILKHAGLGKEVSNGIIRVAKVEKLQKEEEDRKRLDDAKALSGDTQSITRPLSFAKASEAKAILDKMLTKRGNIIIDERTNTLIITDLPRNLPLVDDLIAQLDVQIQQVQIEARVVEATKNWQKAFGVQWPTSNTGSAAITTGGSTAATWGSTNGPSWNSINNQPSAGGNSLVGSFSPGVVGVTDIPSPAGQFWLSFLSNRMSVNVILQALESEGVVKIVSSPKVVTQNNKKAKVLSGQKIPYPTTQAGNNSGAITVSFADANLSLEVTPQITNNGTILMDIHLEKDDANFSQEVSGTPTITTRMIETQVLVKDGGTAIMGGVYQNTNSHSTTGVPFLSHLPLIGFLFRNKIDSDNNDELLLFITPHVLRD
jgi:type IV pilus assembly protein PilQ